MGIPPDNVVIAGGGLAAIRTAQALRDLKYPGRITLLSDEACLPYDRPPLSKAYLQGKADEEKIRLASPDRVTELDIEARLNKPVAGVDVNERQVRLADGTRVETIESLDQDGTLELQRDHPADNVKARGRIIHNRLTV